MALVNNSFTRAGYKTMKSKLDNGISSDSILTFADTQIEFDATKTFTFTNENITNDSYCSIYYEDIDTAETCNIISVLNNHSVVFQCDTIPSDTITCTIIIENEPQGGE